MRGRGSGVSPAMKPTAFIALFLASPSLAGAQDDALFTQALELADIVVEHGCPHRLVGSDAHPFREADSACDTYVALALASLSVDRPERRQRALAALERLFTHVLSARARGPFRSAGIVHVGDRRLPRSVLYRGYALLVATSIERVGGASPPIADALADSLAADLEASPAGWLPSFGRAIWPCDHAPAAAALALHARGRSGPAAERWARASRALVERLSRLLATQFHTRVDASGSPIQPLPRGTVLAFTAGFLLHADRALAAPFARTLTQDFCDRLDGSAACREWPRGIDRPADAVSGPILGGYATGASALAIGATRSLDDASFHRDLSATADRMMTGALADPRRRPLENAILLWARTAQPL